MKVIRGIGIVLAVLILYFMLALDIEGLVYSIQHGMAGLAVLLALPILLGVAFLIWAYKRKAAKDEALQRQEEERQLFEQRQREFDEYLAELSTLGEQALVSFEESPVALLDAQGYMNQAEVDFEEHAYAPFWDSIEKAAASLAMFNNHVNSVKAKIANYTKMLGEPPEYYENDIVSEGRYIPNELPISPESLERLDIGEIVAERLGQLVRRAQSDFQFAMIFEQPKN